MAGVFERDRFSGLMDPIKQLTKIGFVGWLILPFARRMARKHGIETKPSNLRKRHEARMEAFDAAGTELDKLLD